MCFSSQTTCATPSRRYSANASAGCSSRPGSLARLARRHRRRQVDQPLRIGGEPAHHLQGRRRRSPRESSRCRSQPRGMIRLPSTSSRSSTSSCACCAVSAGAGSGTGRKGRAGSAVCLGRGDGDELLLGVTQGGQPAAEDAAGVDVDRPVQPLRLRNRRVTVDDIARPRYSAAQLQRTGRPNSSVSPVVSP